MKKVENFNVKNKGAGNGSKNAVDVSTAMKSAKIKPLIHSIRKNSENKTIRDFIKKTKGLTPLLVTTKTANSNSTTGPSSGATNSTVKPKSKSEKMIRSTYVWMPVEFQVGHFIYAVGVLVLIIVGAVISVVHASSFETTFFFHNF